MNAGDKLCSIAVRRVVFQQQFAGLLVQGGLWIRVNEEALDSDQNMSDAVSRFPVFLERVHTNFTVGPHIWVKNLGGKPTFRWRSRKFFSKFELDSEISTCIRCTVRTLDNTGDIQHVFVTGLNADSLRWILFQIA